jgi:hypothetical protein
LTPLRMALGGRHGKVARLLLRNSADAGAQDIISRTDSGTYDNINGTHFEKHHNMVVLQCVVMELLCDNRTGCLNVTVKEERSRE